MGVPQIIHLNGFFHHKPIILRIFWVPPFMEHPKQPSPGGGGVASWKGWKDTTDGWKGNKSFNDSWSVGNDSWKALESAVYFADFWGLQCEIARIF
jgi:hypothetical protein